MPTSEGVIGIKRIWYDENFCTVPFIFQAINLYWRRCVDNYNACIYDNHWLFGLLVSKQEDDGDINMKFLYSSGSALSFHWPSKENICFIPI